MRKDETVNYFTFIDNGYGYLWRARRYAEMRRAAVMLTGLLNNKNPRVKEEEDALIAVTDVLHVDDESGGGEEEELEGE